MKFWKSRFVDLIRKTLYKVIGEGTKLMYNVMVDKTSIPNQTVNLEASNRSTAVTPKSIFGANKAPNFLQAPAVSGFGSTLEPPTITLTPKSPFLDSVLAAIEAGEWNQVGQLIAQKLNETLAAIPWPDIQDKAQTWAANIADTLNGFIARLDWRLVGSTLAQGLNTALIFADTLVQSIHWDTLGNGIGNGMNQCVEELDWEAPWSRDDCQVEDHLRDTARVYPNL